MTSKRITVQDKSLMARYGFILIPALAIGLSLLAASVVILLVGKNPFQAFYSLLQGAGVLPKPSYAAYKGLLTDFMSLLNALTPMIFAALAVGVALKAGLFNIGVSGQMLFAGFMATVIVGYSSLAAPIAKPLVLLVGVASGALVGGLIGFLKHRFNINEVVSSIMLNYTIQYAISFFITMYHIDPVSRQSRNVSAASRLTLVNQEVGAYKMDLPLGIILAIVCALALAFVFQSTTLGYSLKAVGASPQAAKYAGMNVGLMRVLAMGLSGGLAGLAGVTYYLGYFASIGPKTLSSVGFDAIAVSLLGNAHPIGTIFSSLLITIISKGSTYMSSTVGVDQEIAAVITGLILLFSACGGYLQLRLARRREKKSRKEVAAHGNHAH